MAERKIVAELNSLLSDVVFLNILKGWGAQCACRFLLYREIFIRLKSGRRWKILTPAFLRAKPKRKRGRSPKRQKGALRHLGLKLRGILKRVSPALIEICVSMAVLCPSFEVAANALRRLGITMNEHLLQNITSRFAKLAKNVRIECNSDAVWQKPGIRMLICVDGGGIRERDAQSVANVKKAKNDRATPLTGLSRDCLQLVNLTTMARKSNPSAQFLMGHSACLDDYFELLKEYLLSINLDEASEIVFCADGGKGIWPRTEKLISKLGLSNAKRILDYTHAKQNIDIVKKNNL